MKKDGKHSKPSLPQEGGPEEGSWGEGRHRSHETYSHSIKCENSPGCLTLPKARFLRPGKSGADLKDTVVFGAG